MMENDDFHVQTEKRRRKMKIYLWENFFFFLFWIFLFFHFMIPQYCQFSYFPLWESQTNLWANTKKQEEKAVKWWGILLFIVSLYFLSIFVDCSLLVNHCAGFLDSLLSLFTVSNWEKISSHLLIIRWEHTRMISFLVQLGLEMWMTMMLLFWFSWFLLNLFWNSSRFLTFQRSISMISRNYFFECCFACFFI